MKLISRTLLLAALLVAASAVPAAAHADPVSVSPSPCATVDSATTVEMTFSEELSIEGSRLEVFVGATMVASAGPDLNDLDRASMIAALPSGIEGLVEVEWKSTSVIDDDAASGRHAFTIGGTIEGVDCEAGEADTSTGSASIVVILGLSTVVLVGVVGIARRPARSEV